MSKEVIQLYDSASKTSASIAPSLGFNCFSFQVLCGEERVEVLWADPGFLSGSTKPARTGIPLLFPFAGRIRGVNYDWRGQQYPLEIGDDFGNAIHGFVLNRPWRVVEQSENAVTGEFQASVDDPTLLERWPADFLIRVRYEVAGQTLRQQIEVDNPDKQDLPFGLGVHSYFRTPIGGEADAKDTAGQCRVTAPVGEHWDLEGLLPTGKHQHSELAARLSAGMELGETKLDDLFTGLHRKDGNGTAEVFDPASNRRVTLEFDGKYPALVLFTPPHREAVAIEPYTSVPNAFELGEKTADAPMIVLPPGGKWRAGLSITLSE